MYTYIYVTMEYFRITIFITINIFFFTPFKSYDLISMQTLFEEKEKKKSCFDNVHIIVTD